MREVAGHAFRGGLEQPNGMPFHLGRCFMERDEPVNLRGSELIQISARQAPFTGLFGLFVVGPERVPGCKRRSSDRELRTRLPDTVASDPGGPLAHVRPRHRAIGRCRRPNP
jgi:hypothetical protein